MVKHFRLRMGKVSRKKLFGHSARRALLWHEVCNYHANLAPWNRWRSIQTVSDFRSEQKYSKVESDFASGRHGIEP
jgi:hypothetical protein